MPHEWWHRPEIWSDYAAPALGAVVQAPGVKQTLEGIEALHRRGVVPTVSRALEPLPLRWEETSGVPQDAPWYRPDQRFQQGRVVSNFDQYLTPEGDISPGGILRQLGSVTPAGWAQAIAEENLPITPVRPDTLQQQNIMEEARARGIGPFGQDPFADFTPSGREQREIREDLYKLPPYTRGIAEELPYLAIPPARVMRGGLQAARTGPRFSSFNTATGAARPWAAPARGGIRATEMALKPLEVVEEGLARAVAAPFRGAAAGYRALQPTPPTQVPQIPRGPSAQQAILGPSVEPTPAPGAVPGDYRRQVGGSAAPDVQPTPVQAAPVVPEQAVPEPPVAAAVPEVDRTTLGKPQRLELLRNSENPIVREVMKVLDNRVASGTPQGQATPAEELGSLGTVREFNQIDSIIAPMVNRNILANVPMRIRDQRARGGIRDTLGLQVKNLDGFIDELESIDIAPSKIDTFPQDVPINRESRPDLPEQYFDDAGELLTEDVVTTNYINPIREIVDVDKPRGGWSSVIRKLERQIERTEDADIVEGLDDVVGKIDEFRDMEREGMSALEFGEAKDDAFAEIVSSVDDLIPSNQFADTLEEAVEINRLLADAPEAIPEVPFRTAGYSEFEAAKNLNKRAENLAPKSEQEFARTRAFISEDGNTGYLIDANGDFGNLFSNAGAPKGAGKRAVVQAIEEGALTLDAYAQYLPEYYSKAGWVEVARNRFVDDFAPADWDYEKLGRPDVVHMAYTGGDRSTIINRYGDFTYTQTSNYMEDFDAAKQLARETAEQAERAGGYGRAVTPEEGGAVEATQRGRVVSGEPGVAAEPGPVGGLPEPELTRFERPTAEEPYLWDFELPAGTAQQIEGQADLAITSPQNSTPMAYARKVAELGDAGHSLLMENMSNAVARIATKFKKNSTDKVVDAAKERDRRIADDYVKLTKKWWDGNYVMNVLEDAADFRSTHPNSPSNFGGNSHKVSIGKTPISDRIIKSTGTAVNRGANRYVAFMRDSILPLLERGATPEAIERYVQAKHYQSLAQKPNFKERFKDGVFIYAREVTTAQASRNPEKYKVVDEMVFEKFGWEDLQGWTDINALRSQGFSDDAVRAIQDGANAVRRIYIEERDRLFKGGIIDEARKTDWEDNFKWYHPIDYAEYAEAASDDFSAGIGSGFNVTSDGVYRLSAKPHLMGAMPPLGESMAKNLIQNELRLTRNKVTKDVVDIGIAAELGLKDVSSEFIRRTKNEAGEIVEQLKPVRYDEKLRSGYLSYYSDGKRFVYGSADGTEVPEWLWDALNGRNGLGITGGREIQAQLAAANGWFRSVNTTYNPTFFVRNALIDMLTVSNKAGINPAVSTGRVIKSLYNAATGTEDRLMELMQYGGGWSDRYYDASGNISKITKAIQDSGHDARVALNDKELRKLLEESVNPKTSMGKKVVRSIPATGAAIEQAPRLAVARKALHKYIGKEEYKRIMKLDRKEFEEVMFNNWRPEYDVNDNPITTPQGLHRGLIDSQELQLAAQNSIDATLNFGRGGDQIKRWNNYVLFLNAAMEGFKQPFRSLGINLHPVVRPVRNPVRGEAQFEFGSISEQAKNYLQSIGAITPGGRGITGRSFDVVGGQKMFFDKYGPELIGPRAAAWRMGQILVAYWGIQTVWNKQFTYQGTPLYYDVPSHIRHNSLVYMLDSERNEEGEYVLDPQTGRPVPRYIVMPHKLREWNMFFQSATLLDEATDEDVAMDKSRFGQEVFKSMFPVSDLPIPEAINVGIEEWKGYDMYRQTDIIPEELQGEVPSEQFGPWTSESIRRATGVIDEVPMPDTFSKFLTSPQRVDHLYENIFGGVGKTVSNIADFGLSLVDDLRNFETRPMTERVEEFREMDRTSRTEFTTSLSPEEHEEFEREIRMPRKQLPFWDSLSYSFFPQRGGGLQELGRSQQERLFPNISRDETISAGKAMSKVRRNLLNEQQQNDSYLTNWRDKKTSGGKLSPKEWRDAKSDKWQKYEGATLAVSEIYKRAIQGADDETRDAYYDTLYTAAGMMPDTRMGVDFLLAGYYAIEPTETDPTNVNWDEFFEARAEYVENIRTSSEAAGDDLHAQFTRSLQANDTPTEIAYDESRRMLAPYWNAGKNPDELYPNMQPPLSQAMPQVAQQWTQYLAADRGTQRQMYDSIPLIETLVKRRSQLRDSILIQDGMNGGGLDEALVFWYGDFHEGVTSRGKAFHNKLYGSNGIGFTPRPSPAIPVRTR